ncbi:Protein gamma response 1 [Bienertia sinuspersici]
MHITHSEKSPQVVESSHDTKYISGLSTILVATIQEAKDRISQIEYIFCSQLYPIFQTKSLSLQKLYSEARSAAENEWKERQSELELQMKQALDECKVFKEDKSKLLTRVAELEGKLSQKAKEADDGIELQANLVNLIEMKTTTLRDKEQLIKENEERLKLLVTKLEVLEKNNDGLNNKLHEKNEEVIKERKLTKELWEQIEAQELKITNTEQMLSNSEVEKKELSMKLENVNASLDGLRNELREKIAQVEEGKHLQEKLSQQVNFFGFELQKRNQQLSVYEREKQMLLPTINQLQNKGDEFEECIRIENAGATNVRESHSDLGKQIELLTSQLAAEKQKKRNLLTTCKNLKSQNCFLLEKLGLTNEGRLLQMKAKAEEEVEEKENEKEEESDPLNNKETNITLYESKKRNPASDVVALDFNKMKQENMMESTNDKIGRQNKTLSSMSQSSSDSPAATDWTTSSNVRTLAGGKRPGFSWRETRSRQSPGGPDPHDDFLDTPYENIRGNLYKTVKNNVRGEVPTESLKDMDSDDDETQNTIAESGPKRQQLQAVRSGPKGFKYVEPVRKKAERDNLNGVECKQCKKFYDAVLPEDGAKNGQVDKQNLRCEHHDGVSRHRYRYVPPMTPEGFWNIGFDTET